jgi:undecaprenyl-diphosphatase
MASADTTLFLWLTASLQSPRWAVALATFLASAVVPLVALALMLAWIRARPGWRPALLDALTAGGLGLGLVQVVGWFHYRPRPFEAGLGANLLHHLPENSFPSDHATLMFALAFGLLAAAPLRKAGAVLLGLALAVSWARIYLGVHYPTDILGGLGLALLCVGFVRSLSFRNGLWARVDGIYQWLLTMLHLPSTLFPKGP